MQNWSRFTAPLTLLMQGSDLDVAIESSFLMCALAHTLVDIRTDLSKSPTTIRILMKVIRFSHEEELLCATMRLLDLLLDPPKSCTGQYYKIEELLGSILQHKNWTTYALRVSSCILLQGLLSFPSSLGFDEVYQTKVLSLMHSILTLLDEDQFLFSVAERLEASKVLSAMIQGTKAKNLSRLFPPQVLRCLIDIAKTHPSVSVHIGCILYRVVYTQAQPPEVELMSEEMMAVFNMLLENTSLKHLFAFRSPERCRIALFSGSFRRVKDMNGMRNFRFGPDSTDVYRPPIRDYQLSISWYTHVMEFLENFSPEKSLHMRKTISKFAPKTARSSLFYEDPIGNGIFGYHSDPIFSSYLSRLPRGEAEYLLRKSSQGAKPNMGPQSSSNGNQSIFQYEETTKEPKRETKRRETLEERCEKLKQSMPLLPNAFKTVDKEIPSSIVDVLFYAAQFRWLGDTTSIEFKDFGGIYEISFPIVIDPPMNYSILDRDSLRSLIQSNGREQWWDEVHGYSEDFKFLSRTNFLPLPSVVKMGEEQELYSMACRNRDESIFADGEPQLDGIVPEKKRTDEVARMLQIARYHQILRQDRGKEKEGGLYSKTRAEIKRSENGKVEEEEKEAPKNPFSLRYDPNQARQQSSPSQYDEQGHLNQFILDEGFDDYLEEQELWHRSRAIAERLTSVQYETLRESFGHKHGEEDAEYPLPRKNERIAPPIGMYRPGQLDSLDAKLKLTVEHYPGRLSPYSTSKGDQSDIRELLPPDVSRKLVKSAAVDMEMDEIRAKAETGEKLSAEEGRRYYGDQASLLIRQRQALVKYLQDLERKREFELEQLRQREKERNSSQIQHPRLPTEWYDKKSQKQDVKQHENVELGELKEERKVPEPSKEGESKKSPIMTRYPASKKPIQGKFSSFHSSYMAKLDTWPHDSLQTREKILEHSMWPTQGPLPAAIASAAERHINRYATHPDTSADSLEREEAKEIAKKEESTSLASSMPTSYLEGFDSAKKPPLRPNNHKTTIYPPSQGKEWDEKAKQSETPPLAASMPPPAPRKYLLDEIPSSKGVHIKSKPSDTPQTAKAPPPSKISSSDSAPKASPKEETKVETPVPPNVTARSSTLDASTSSVKDKVAFFKTQFTSADSLSKSQATSSVPLKHSPVSSKIPIRVSPKQSHPPAKPTTAVPIKLTSSIAPAKQKIPVASKEEKSKDDAFKDHLAKIKADRDERAALGTAKFVDAKPIAERVLISSSKVEISKGRVGEDYSSQSRLTRSVAPPRTTSSEINVPITRKAPALIETVVERPKTPGRGKDDSETPM